MPDQGGGGLANLTRAAVSWLLLDRHSNDGRFAAIDVRRSSRRPDTEAEARLSNPAFAAQCLTPDVRPAPGDISKSNQGRPVKEGAARAKEWMLLLLFWFF